MKKKILTLIILLLIAPCLSSLLFHSNAKAEEFVTLSQIMITQYPSKTNYVSGESLDLTDMIVEGYYSDGTSNAITDYVVEGYDCNKIGIQSVFINYQNYTAVFNITVMLGKVANISVSNHSTTSHTLTWEAFANVTRYDIYSLDDITGTYNLLATTESNSITFNYSPGTIHNYQICATQNIDGIEYKSDFSDTYTAATDPEIVNGLAVNETTTSSVSLTWNGVSGATGYIIYRSPVSTTNYSYCGETGSTSYQDKRVAAGTSYKYKVSAYTLEQTYLGSDSSDVETSTKPAKIALKYKIGDQKIRLTWPKIIGASSYDIYMGDDITGYSLLTTKLANSSSSYIADGLITGKDYSFYAIAHRNYNGVVYDSPVSDIKILTLNKIKETSTAAKYFSNSLDFRNSWAYKKLAFFRKNVKYTKSIVIPGLVTTNIGGFSSTAMCPQGITFAEDYLLLTAYDLASEENSVIYVMDKWSKELLTTLILPSKAHAGGISYDGTNIWVANGTKVSAIPFSEIETITQEGNPYSYINYNTTCALGISVSYISYYNEKLWVGSYNELQATNMYSYSIEDKGTAPTLTKENRIYMPTRVQGVVFTSKGELIISRSCQLYSGLRGYIHQLDVYKPDFSNESKAYIQLGKCANTVIMPSMNEEIALDGSYLYVNFESGAFDRASYKMDRISSFKLSSITKKIPLK